MNHLETVSAPEADARAAGIIANRNLGLVACLIGALVMISGRYATWAPTWLVYVGVAAIAFGWALFGYTLYQRAVLARANVRKVER